MAFATILQIAQTMVLARLLLPAEFGLMAVATALTSVFALVADLGISRALIHFEIPTRAELSSLYWLNLGVACLLAIVVAAVSPLLGLIYGSKDLGSVLQVSSLVFPLTAFGQQFRVLAEKQLRFADVARNEIFAGLVGFIVAVAIAYWGGGVYALVGGMLGTAAASSALAWLQLSDGYSPMFRFRAGDARSCVGYGSYMLGESLVNVLNRQADVYVGGAVLGPLAMGSYSVPRDFSLRLGKSINQVITRVGFPVMAGVQKDGAQLASIYLKTLRMTASVNFPLYVGLALYADEVVLLLFGPQWQGAGTYMLIFALWGLIRSIGQPIGALLYAVGMARQSLWWNVGQLLLLPPVYWLAAHAGGLEALAWSALAAQVLMVLPAWHFLVFPACGVGLTDFLRQPLVPLLVALAAGLIAFLATLPLDAPVMRLAVGAMAGGLGYMALSYVFNRHWVDAMMDLMHAGHFRKRSA